MAWGRLCGEVVCELSLKGWMIRSLTRGVKGKCKVEGRVVGTGICLSEHLLFHPLSRSWLCLWPKGSGNLTPHLFLGEDHIAWSVIILSLLMLHPQALVINLVSCVPISTVCRCEAQNSCTREATFRMMPTHCRAYSRESEKNSRRHLQIKPYWCLLQLWTS